ncbi:hypothetical protein J7E62_27580 [Variovorax paradoxus]|nr:hypothetical protein [Variovorax paradoxus]
MMLTLKPAGRGNWNALYMAIEGAHLAPLVVRIGDIWTLSGIRYRIVSVMP